MKEVVNFFKNRTVQKHLMYAFGGLFLLIILVFLSLRVYTRHGQALSVPDFSGLTLEGTSKMADQKRLRFVVNDSVFVPGTAPGTVITQNPSAGTKVKENRTIFLTINAINPEKVLMPNVVGVSFRQAEAILQSGGLRVGLKIYIPDIARDYVLRQQYRGRDIPHGHKVIKGSNIDLVLGSGLGNNNITVPDIKRLTKKEAQEILSNNYLNFGALIYDNSVESMQDSLKAVIWKQRPVYGTSTRSGASIDVWLRLNESKENPDTTKMR
jgi:eukaryotic-like serine/threonine-protein kinase